MMKYRIFHSSPHNLLFFLTFYLFVSCQPEDKSSSAENIIQTDLTSKVKEPSEKTNNFYGPSKPMGNGVVRTVVTLNQEGIPTAVGIEISEKVLEGLPDEEQNLHLELSNKANDVGLIVDHVDIGWNPHGHEPTGIYTLPHFDLHFYWVSVEEVDQVEFSAGIDDLPPTEFWPANYGFDEVTVPSMGRHWLYLFAPELPPNGGATFTQTFIYGSYDYEFTFYEPMITRDYLAAKDFEDTYSISQADNFARSGYYANSYEITYDPVKKKYRVMLTNLHWEDGVEDL